MIALTSQGATGALGTVLGDSEDAVDVLTSGGYEMDFSYNGDAGDPEYIYYSGSGCTGSVYLNDGNGVAGDYMNPRQVFWGATDGSALYVVSSTASLSESYASTSIPRAPSRGSCAGRRKLDSSSPVPPPGGRSMTM